MASAPRSTPLDVRNQRPSFAKVFTDAYSRRLAPELTGQQIAASGIKPQNAHTHTTNNESNNIQKNDTSSPPHNGAPIVTSSNADIQPSAAVTQMKLAQEESEHSAELGASGPQVRVQIVESVPQRASGPAPEGLLMPASDDVGTQVSSSSGSNKPQSLDGKSVASGTTFALDEKDSLRPDDSASVKAVDEDDVFSPPSSGLPDSRIGSDIGVRAFHDQLREISSMEPSRRPPPPHIYGNVPKGVLYVPPQEPGIGSVPNSSQPQAGVIPNVDVPPDQKLLEALENPRDRVWVLKLEQDVIDFVKDPKESSLTLPQCHSFYRLLAHKMADYYMLGHLVEDSAAAVRLYKTENCRIPPPLTGITAPSTAASTPPPAAPMMKILRRGVDGPAIANGSNMNSKNGSENGDDDKPKAPATREEREARYEAARLRIMGSAKPVDTPEETKEKQVSRSSSTAGKNKKKKQRADSDDDFEARSAYSNYYTPSFDSAGVSSGTYGYQSFADGAQSHYSNIYGQQMQNAGGAQQAPPQVSGHPNWTQQQYQNIDPTQAWAQGQSGSYDLPASFQRALSIQPGAPSPTQNSNFSTIYGQQYYGAPQQSWPQQQQQAQPPQPPQYQAQGQLRVAQPEYSLPNAYTPTQTHAQLDQPYAFGQLPSQTFPGRPSSKSEHPLPGSYRGKHFNPQSQTFVPQPTTGNRPFTPQGVSPVGNNFAAGYAAPTLQRQNSAQSQGSAFGSPRHGPNSPHAMPQNRVPSQPMTHPLPQPVFQRHPSPNIPLPPKPTAATQQQHPSATAPVPNQSLLAKWGAPASLPAKPPPSNESFDSTMATAHAQRPPFISAAAAARQPSGGGGGGGYPSFAATGGTQIVNGSGAAGKRS